jgi:hypothetical protein
MHDEVRSPIKHRLALHQIDRSRTLGRAEAAAGRAGPASGVLQDSPEVIEKQCSYYRAAYRIGKPGWKWLIVPAVVAHHEPPSFTLGGAYGFIMNLLQAPLGLAAYYPAKNLT